MMQDLQKRMEIVKAKELLGIPLQTTLDYRRAMETKESYKAGAGDGIGVAVEDTNKQTLIDINIQLLRENKKLEAKLEAAINEKASNLEIRKIVDRLPGTHYQLSEKIEILKVLVEFANRLYDVKAYIIKKESPSGEITNELGRNCESRYNLSKIVEYVKALMEWY